MIYKRKKFLIKIVLMIVTVSTLLSCFSIFGSAASYTSRSVADTPYKLYWLVGTGNSDTQTLAYWNTPDITSTDRIAFGAMGSANGMWHIYPFVQGQQSSASVINYYNSGFGSLEDARPMINRSSLLPSSSYEYWFSYSPTQSNVSFSVIIKMKEDIIKNFDAEWVPMYVISVFYINRDGKFIKTVDPGTFTEMSAFCEGTIKLDANRTVLYPYFDCGYFLRHFYSNINRDIKGVQLQIDEYFYNKNDYFVNQSGNGTHYPIYNADFGNNLYLTDYNNLNGGTYGAHFKSYPLKYYFDDLSTSRSQYNIGYAKGRADGFAEGKAVGVDIGANYNAVDGILSLAQVPSTFISSMLDFNFFGINLANTVKVIFTVLIIAFIVVLLLKFLL